MFPIVLLLPSHLLLCPCLMLFALLRTHSQPPSHFCCPNPSSSSGPNSNPLPIKPFLMLKKDESLCSFKLYPELKILKTWFYQGTYPSPWITVTRHVLPRGSKQLEIQHYLGLTCKLLAALPHRSTNSIHWDKEGGVWVFHEFSRHEWHVGLY